MIHTDHLTGLKPGVSEDLVRRLSADKKEPVWMLELRLKAYKIFTDKQMPGFGPSLSGLDLEKIVYYASPGEIRNAKKWEDVPEEIKKTFDKLGIPEAERKALAGVGAQYESEVVYHNLKSKWKEMGILYEDLSVALVDHEDIVRKYFSKCLSLAEHKYMALHYAFWSGGTFLYIPKGVKLDMPVQSYFRMNTPGLGQFEHTLIVVEDDAVAHYIEGCSAPRYDSTALHAGGVEVFVGKNARCRYSSIENWSIDVHNLNTKRAMVEEKGVIEWVTGNLGSCISMVYPCSVLKGDGSKAEHLSVAFAGENQIQDVGAKVIHIGRNTSSHIMAKGLAKDGGKSHYRGLVNILPGAANAKCSVRCDALLLDPISGSDTFPYIKVDNDTSECVHEAATGKISPDQIFYLKSRGLSENQAVSLIINGFIEPIMKEIPLEYAVEMNRLIQMEIDEGGWVG
ncbi:MAG: Fe-S cluster assembly protein SufB [Parcubacteria group bacterium Gr01-1014_18]|nr:MAG: Fe-S cluster assembly protein SufB [Parcubacteria group bacterium Greene0416_36]TSC80706.1 MAG: Fe-S cluster assembly protein SufB [Parcubacteria group bacterium Gr01-1014_18]TSC98683.1 MAG: Fe-S cluster assembly protein SufB [Parcubacteria group bacterium Greene1014_20]TSD07157.1 MAG: Fe-S cluster assembly protein SufB [Parcubacteria group bacterium Greene0714_2]